MTMRFPTDDTEIIATGSDGDVIVLADADGVNTSASIVTVVPRLESPASNTPPIPLAACDDAEEQVILEALRNPKDRMFMLKLGDAMESLIADRGHRTRSDLPPCVSTYHRLLVHRCASFYKLTPETDSVTKAISVTLSAESKTPIRRLADLVPSPSESTMGPSFQIMRRLPTTSSRSQSSEGLDLSDAEGPAPSEAGSSISHSTSNSKRRHNNRPTMSEREAAYHEARSRIFMGFQEKENSSSSSLGLVVSGPRSGSSNVSVSASASASNSSSGGDDGDNASTAPTESERSYHPSSNASSNNKKPGARKSSGGAPNNHTSDSRNRRHLHPHSHSQSPELASPDANSPELGHGPGVDPATGLFIPALYDASLAQSQGQPIPPPPPQDSANTQTMPPPPVLYPYPAYPYPAYPYPYPPPYYGYYPYPPPPPPNQGGVEGEGYQQQTPPPQQVAYVPVVWGPPPPPPGQHQDIGTGNSDYQPPHHSQQLQQQPPPPQDWAQPPNQNQPPTQPPQAGYPYPYPYYPHVPPPAISTAPVPPQQEQEFYTSSPAYPPPMITSATLTNHNQIQHQQHVRTDSFGSQRPRRGGTTMGPRSNSGGTNGRRRGGAGRDDVSVASSSSSSAPSTTHSPHPLPPRPDWAVGLTPIPFGANGSMNHQRREKEDLKDFPPLPSGGAMQIRTQTSPDDNGGVWAIGRNSNPTSSAGSVNGSQGAAPSPPGQFIDNGGSTGSVSPSTYGFPNQFYGYPAYVDQTPTQMHASAYSPPLLPPHVQSHISAQTQQQQLPRHNSRLDDGRFDRLPPRGKGELFNPKARGNSPGGPQNTGTLGSRSNKDGKEKRDESKKRGEAVKGGTIIVEGIQGLKLA